MNSQNSKKNDLPRHALNLGGKINSRRPRRTYLNSV